VTGTETAVKIGEMHRGPRTKEVVVLVGGGEDDVLVEIRKAKLEEGVWTERESGRTYTLGQAVAFRDLLTEAIDRASNGD
jgi:hypothetical protein